MLDNKTIYFPAMSAGTQISALEKDIKHFKNEKSYRTYDDNSFFDYPYILISAGHNYKKNTAKIINYDLTKKDNILLGDSGGYQVATGVTPFTEKFRDDIFYWLENNTNYALNLDIPTWNLKSHETDEFKKRVLLSKKNFEYFMEHKSGSTKYMNVLQGRTLNELERWYDVIKDFYFEGGWGIGGSSPNLFLLFQSFFFLYEKGEFHKHAGKKALIHILGYSKIKNLYIILYLQQKLNELGIDIQITYDSSTPFLQAAYGRYVAFIRKEGVNYMSFLNSVIKEKQFINLDELLPCKCPLCIDITYKDIFQFTTETGFSSEFYYLLGNHNLYHFIQHKIVLERLLSLGNKDILATVFNVEDMRIFNFIDECFNVEKPTEYINRNRILLSKFFDELSISKKTFF